MRKKIVVAAGLIAISTFNPSCKHVQHTDSANSHGHQVVVVSTTTNALFPGFWYSQMSKY